MAGDEAEVLIVEEDLVVEIAVELVQFNPLSIIRRRSKQEECADQ